jgi:hypothetical protein
MLSSWILIHWKFISTLTNEAVYSSEILLTTDHATWCHNLEDQDMNLNRLKKPRYDILFGKH